MRGTGRTAASRRASVGIAAWIALGAGAIGAYEACSTSQTLACPADAPACPTLDGVTTFCAWAQWGCAAEAPCEGYLGVVEQTSDARFTWLYAAASGAYVATVQEDFAGGHPACANGPPSVSWPAGCAFETVASCAPPLQDAGLQRIDGPPPEAGGPRGAPSGEALAQPPK